MFSFIFPWCEVRSWIKSHHRHSLTSIQSLASDYLQLTYHHCQADSKHINKWEMRIRQSKYIISHHTSFINICDCERASLLFCRRNYIIISISLCSCDLIWRWWYHTRNSSVNSCIHRGIRSTANSTTLSVLRCRSNLSWDWWCTISSLNIGIVTATKSQ